MKQDWTGSSRINALSRGIDDRSAWKAVLDLYYEDKVVEALDLIKRTGAGEGGGYLRLYRLIEAEAISRAGSTVARLAPFLDVEFIPEETFGGIEPYAPIILRACDRVSRDLQFAHGPPTRIAFLSEAANAPWATSPHGYCMDMYPYEKLCMPCNLFSNPARLATVVAHEYAHVATLNTTQGRATRWSEEAVSMQFEPRHDTRARRGFAAGDEPWLDPNRLILAFGSEDEVEVWHAYEQAMWVGRYLRSVGGDASLARFVKAMGEDAWWPGLKARALGWVAEEHSVRTVYGMALDVAFEKALDWLRAGCPWDVGPFPG